MKINHPIEINLLEVFRTGSFDYLKIGNSKEWILNNFPDPDDIVDGETIMSSNIWRYGNIELFFDGNNLTQIYSDYIDCLDGGDKIKLNKWIFENYKKLTVEYVIKHLIEERINFQVNHTIGEHIVQTSIGLVNSFVHLNFQPSEDINIDQYHDCYKNRIIL